MSTIEPIPRARVENSDIPVHPRRRKTEEEFVEWCGDFWAEWVDGEVILMSPVNDPHASAFSFLHRLIGNFVEFHELGEIRAEPFQIRLARQKRRRSPDIFFFTNAQADRLRYTHFEGAPDLIVEIVSPGSESRDWREKYGEYERAGVTEYWIVDPASQRIEAYRLTKSKRYAQIPIINDRIGSNVLPRFYLSPSWFEKTKLPGVLRVLKEMGVSA
jgi:Uma2 family endonuclease